MLGGLKKGSTPLKDVQCIQDMIAAMPGSLIADFARTNGSNMIDGSGPERNVV